MPNLEIGDSPLAGIQSDTLNDFVALVEAGQSPAVLPAYEYADNGNRIAYVVPDDHELKTLDFEKLALTPRRKTGTVTLRDATSFATYVQMHVTAGTHLFANKTEMLAVFNHHEPRTGAPGWGDFRARLLLELTREWLWWREFANKFHEASFFADGVEQHQHAVSEPATGVLLDLVRKIQITSRMTYETNSRVGNNTTKLVFGQEDEAKTDKTTFNVDDGMVVNLKLRLYTGGDEIEVPGRLSYYLKNVSGKVQLMWRIELFGLDEAEDIATQNRMAIVANQVGLPVLLGMPS